MKSSVGGWVSVVCYLEFSSLMACLAELSCLAGSGPDAAVPSA